MNLEYDSKINMSESNRFDKKINLIRESGERSNKRERKEREKTNFTWKNRWMIMIISKGLFITIWIKRKSKKLRY